MLVLGAYAQRIFGLDVSGEKRVQDKLRSKQQMAHSLVPCFQNPSIRSNDVMLGIVCILNIRKFWTTKLDVIIEVLSVDREAQC